MTQQGIPSPKPRRTRAQVRALVRLYHQSGLTQQGFCRAHGVCAGSLSTWLSRERVAIKGFVPVTLPDNGGEPGACIHFSDGLELQLPGSWPASKSLSW